MSELNLWVLNKIEGYCLRVIKESKEFSSNPANDDFIDVNTHHERQQMAEKILNIIQENKK
tara:strand:- start:1157 stop:1339 length:183 start_codon:yes stop_codon:yes gene_type:complete